jgi:hypothetical protein
VKDLLDAPSPSGCAASSECACWVCGSSGSIWPGLATRAPAAVMVIGAALSMVDMLPMLVGLVCWLPSASSLCGMEICGAIAAKGSLTTFAATLTGASCGLLMPLDCAPIRSPSALDCGFSLVWRACSFSFSMRMRFCAAISAAPVSSADEGKDTDFGDTGEGDRWPCMSGDLRRFRGLEGFRNWPADARAAKPPAEFA